MKNIYRLIALATALFCNSLAFAGADVPSGLAVVNIKGASEKAQYLPIRTNLVKTNYTFVLKSTANNFTVNAGWLVSLLENSFHTNFPTGSQLLLTGKGPDYSFAVGDGTNAPFYVSQVLSVSPSAEPVYSGTEAYTTNNSAGGYIKGTDAESVTDVLTITYDDYAMTNTVDLTHTAFSWTCLEQASFSQNLVNGSFVEDVTMSLTGGGPVRGQDRSPAIFTGTIRAKLSN